MTIFEQGAIVLIALSFVTVLLVTLLNRTGERIADDARAALQDLEEMKTAMAGLGFSPEDCARLEQAMEVAHARIAEEFEAETGVPLAVFEAELASANQPREHRADSDDARGFNVPPELVPEIKARVAELAAAADAESDPDDARVLPLIEALTEASEIAEAGGEPDLGKCIDVLQMVWALGGVSVALASLQSVADAALQKLADAEAREAGQKNAATETTP